jgi:S-adenosylmethionine:diacylglycerol 3-amino-3-carboxypropyl transferase
VEIREAFRRNYKPALLAYLSRGGEAELRRGYELGRDAIARGLSLLEIVQLHHAVLVEVLRSSDAGDVERVAEGASELLVEVLVTFEMTQRAFDEPRSTPEPPADPPVR